MAPSIEEILDSIEENSEDVFSLDPSFRTSLRDTLEYFDEEYEEDDDCE